MYYEHSLGLVDKIIDLYDQTEVSKEFALWNGLFAVSVSLRRNCFFDLNDKLLYPNLCINFVSATGACRNSTSISSLETILRFVKPSIKVISNYLTTNCLFDAFNEGPISCLVFKEVAVEINLKSCYDGAIISLLTRLYDCEDIECIAFNRNKSIKNSCLSICLGINIKWIKEYLLSCSEGFIARTVFIYQDKQSKVIPWPTMNESKFDEIIGDLSKLSNLHGPISLSDSAKDTYTNEFDKFLVDEDSLLYSYSKRRHLHLLKIAMLISTSKRGDLEITEEDMQDAVRILESTEVKRDFVMKKILERKEEEK